MFNEHSTEAIVKTKSWGFWLILALVITGAYTMVFGVITVKQVNEELVVEEYVDMNQFIPFYDWFNGDTPIEHPELNKANTTLNGHSLKYVFEQNNIISDMTSFVKSPSFINLQIENDVYRIYVENQTIVTYYKIASITLNNKYYIKTFMKRNTNDFTQTVIFRTQWTSSVGIYLDANTNWQEKSAIYIADIGTGQTRFQTSSTNATYHDISFKKSYLIDMTSHGISSLTVSQMDEYYNQYEYYKNYTDFDIYSLDAYNVSRETLIYYHELYQKLLVIQGERAPVKIVSVNPEYNVQLGASIMATLKNTADFIQTTANGLPRLYNDIKNIMGDIGKWFN